MSSTKKKRKNVVRNDSAAVKLPRIVNPGHLSKKRKILSVDAPKNSTLLNFAPSVGSQCDFRWQFSIFKRRFFF